MENNMKLLFSQRIPLTLFLKKHNSSSSELKKENKDCALVDDDFTVTWADGTTSLMIA